MPMICAANGPENNICCSKPSDIAAKSETLISRLPASETNTPMGISISHHPGAVPFLSNTKRRFL